MEDFRKPNGAIDFTKFAEYLDEQVEKMEQLLVSAPHPPKQPVNANHRSCLTGASFELCDQENHKTSAKWLYNKIVEIFENRSANVAYPKIASKTGSELLTLLTQEWGNHATMRTWLSSLLLGIETEYCRIRGLELPAQVADKKFAENVFRPLKGRVGKLLEAEFTKEDSDKEATWSALQTCCDLFIKFGSTDDDFELLRNIGKRNSASGTLINNAASG
eukprot:gb/GECG01005057.1/.p1 GENE.gb/GECG01005057.1/~~gb/GECG01005057.1/.p1  ORF type:complete len:219 (+),score=25.93 gb/GECG01005057.1/:1-657(+)